MAISSVYIFLIESMEPSDIFVPFCEAPHQDGFISLCLVRMCKEPEALVILD